MFPITGTLAIAPALRSLGLEPPEALALALKHFLEFGRLLGRQERRDLLVHLAELSARGRDRVATQGPEILGAPVKNGVNLCPLPGGQGEFLGHLPELFHHERAECSLVRGLVLEPQRHESTRGSPGGEDAHKA